MEAQFPGGPWQLGNFPSVDGTVSRPGLAALKARASRTRVLRKREPIRPATLRSSPHGERGGVSPPVRGGVSPPVRGGVSPPVRGGVSPPVQFGEERRGGEGCPGTSLSADRD